MNTCTDLSISKKDHRLNPAYFVGGDRASKSATWAITKTNYRVYSDQGNRRRRLMYEQMGSKGPQPGVDIGELPYLNEFGQEAANMDGDADSVTLHAPLVLAEVNPRWVARH